MDETLRRRVAALAEHDRIGELLALIPVREVAEGWCRYRVSGSDDYQHPDFWAVEVWLSEEFDRMTDQIRAALLDLVDHCHEVPPGEIGAGPLEDYLLVRPGHEDRIAWAEQQSANSPRFREALAAVRHLGSLPDDLASRIRRAADGLEA
jgi:hypothetical protein